MASENGFGLQSLEELVAQGEALIQARRNPEKGRKELPDFGDSYRRWHIAGKELLAGLSGPRAVKEWDLGQCRGM